MKASIQDRLRQVAARYEEVGLLLSEQEVFSQPNRYRELSVEYSQLEPLARAWTRWQAMQAAVEEARQMLQEDEPELRAMARDELATGEQRLTELEQEIQLLLLPRDPRDDNNIFLEVRAGTGGDEAAIFAGDLFRMYQKYAESRGWSLEIYSQNEGEHGGFKEVVARVVGAGAYSRFKFESGTHRVQRVPETESQGRIHTSACTVAILPEAEEVEEIDLNPAELRVDTRTSAHSTRTAHEPCHCCRRACWNRSRSARKTKSPKNAACRSAAVIVHSGSVPTIFRRAGSPITAST
jgi:peptide chain release factor 1